MCYKGCIMSEESKKKMSASKKGKKQSEEWIQKKVNTRKGYRHSEETKEKIALGNKGKIHTDEQNKKQSLFFKGKIVWNKGKRGVYSEDTLKKMSEAHKGYKSALWQGGVWHSKYSDKWNKSLKQSIRERDNFNCQLCNKKQEKKLFAVHHIDYDKENCNQNNLITLCVSCHAKTNSKRDYWEEYFKTNFNKLLNTKL